jgi:hypothetical protein
MKGFRMTERAAVLFLLAAGCYESSGVKNDIQADDHVGPPPDLPADLPPEFRPDIVPDVIPDVAIDDGPACPIACPAGWTAACQGSTAWCISSYRGVGDCCEQWRDCRPLDAYPGFWPTAGPYDFLPPDFFDVTELPATLIVYSGYSGTTEIVASIVCFDLDGLKVGGEFHFIPQTLDCALASMCQPWMESPSCEGDGVGCACEYPYWCVQYDDPRP